MTKILNIQDKNLAPDDSQWYCIYLDGELLLKTKEPTIYVTLKNRR